MDNIEKEAEKAAKVKINTVFFFVLLFTFLGLGFLIVQPFWQIIVFSAFIVIVANPIHKKIRHKMPNDTVASLVSTLMILLFLLIPGSLFSFIIISQIINLIPIIVNFFAENTTYTQYINKLPTFMVDAFEKIKIYLDASGTNIDFIEISKNHLGNVANFTIEKSQGLLANVGSFLITIIFVLITIFFLFRDSKRYYELIYNLIPMKREEKDFLIDGSAKAISAIFLGTLLTAIAQGTLGFIAYFTAGVSFSLFWGFSTFIMAFLPIGGSTLIWIPIAIYCFFTKGITTGFLMVLWGTFVISLSDNIIRPLVIGGQTNIGTLTLIFAMLGGVQLFGFIGLFLAPVIVITFLNLLALYQKRISEYNDNDLLESCRNV